MSLLHTVLLSFEPELGEDDVEEMYAQVRAWPDEIGDFEQLAIGPPITSERVRGYQFLLHIVVADEEALERYQVHPVHQRFATWVRERGGLVLAFDYVLDRETVVVPGAPADDPGAQGRADDPPGASAEVGAEVQP